MNIAPANGRKPRFPISVILVLCWLAVVGAAEWFHAAAEREPPEWDVLSYAIKASNVWDAIGHGDVGGLLDVPPTVRPPGTVLMSYPLGFSNAYRGFYFRSVFIPLLLVIGAVYIVGYFPETATEPRWPLAALALTAGGMPILFQFQGNDAIPAAVTWGLVDSFLAGVAAIAIASAQRSIVRRSPWWALGSSITATFCLLIKPAGLLVMAIVAAGWVILICFEVRWRVVELWRVAELRKLCLTWLAGTAVVYGLSIGSALSSQYLGAANLASGAAALAVLQQDFSVPVTFETLASYFHSSLGFPVVLLIGAGLVSAACARGERGAAAVAAACWAAGLWFWIVATGIAQVRYFVPFGVMTFVVVVPSLLRLMRRLPRAVGVASAAVMMAATAAITVLLVVPRPSPDWQRSLGVNLSSGVFRAENAQALQLLATLQRRGTESASVYFVEMSSPARSFGAVFSYWTFVNPALPRISVRWPITWETATTFRLGDIATADYTVFAPLEEVQVQSVLGARAVPDLGAETVLMKAWFTSLTPDDGVETMSETRLRVIRIADRERFKQAIEAFRGAHDWRAAFLAANPQS